MVQTPLRFPLVVLAAAMSLPSIPAQKGQDAAQERKVTAHPRGALVALVGKQEIRERDLVAELNRQIPLVYYHRKVTREKLDELRQSALHKLIEKSLIQQDAVERHIEVGDDEVRAEFKKMLAKSGKQYENVSKAEFEKLLTRFRPLVERRILISKNETRFRAALPKVKPESLQAVYDQMLKNDRDSLMSPPEAHLHHIFIKVKPSAAAQQFTKKKARADAARELLVAGKPFAEVARLYSEDEYAKKGGDLGVVGRGSFRSSKIDKAAFALAAGELSPVLRSLYGFHIVHCVKVQPRRLNTLEDVRSMLQAWVEKQHHEQARKAWLEKMRAHFGVEIKKLPGKQPADKPDKRGKVGEAVGTHPGKRG